MQFISAAALVAGTVGQYNNQKKQASLQQQSNDLATRRSSIQAIREVQMKRASVVNEAVSQGATGGSAVSGGISSLGSQLGSGLGYASQQSALSTASSNAAQRADLFGTIAKVGGYGVQKFGLPGSTTGTSSQ
jgi:hypothetical protein